MTFIYKFAILVNKMGDIELSIVYIEISIIDVDISIVDINKLILDIDISIIDSYINRRY